MSSTKELASLSKADKLTCQLLYKAIEDEDPEELSVLLKNSPEINVLNEDGKSPLHVAIEKANFKIYEILMNTSPKPIDINLCGHNKKTPLHFATEFFDQKIMQDLCERDGIQVNAKDEANETPLHLAIVLNKRKAAVILLRSNANIEEENGDNLRPLHKAIRYEQDDILKLLLNDLEIELNVVLENGSTALSMACELGNEEAVSALISRQANQIPNPKNGYLPIHVAAQHGHLRLVKRLDDEFPESIKEKTNNGDTIAHLAAHSNHFHVLEYLINEHQMDVDTPNKKGYTPLHYAASKENARESVEVLIRNGADIQALTENGLNSLHCAANANSSGAIQLLVNAGLDINGKSRDNNTSLHFAVKKCKLSAVGVLIGLGAKLDVAGPNNLTAEQLANQLPDSPDKQALIEMLNRAKTDRNSVTIEVLLKELCAINNNVSNVRRENRVLADKSKEIHEKMKNIKHHKTPSIDSFQTDTSANADQQPGQDQQNLEVLDQVLANVRETGDFKELLPYLKEPMTFKGAKTQEQYNAEIEGYEKERKIFECFEEFLRGRLDENDENIEVNNKLDNLRREEVELREKLENLKIENEMLQEKQQKSRQIKEKILKMNECMKCRDSGPMNIYECGHVFCKDDSKGDRCPKCQKESKAIAIQNDSDPNAAEITEQAVEKMLEELIKRDKAAKGEKIGGGAGDRIQADLPD